MNIYAAKNKGYKGYDEIHQVRGWSVHPFN